MWMGKCGVMRERGTIENGKEKWFEGTRVLV
jgi:hypothetical protein